MRRRLLLANASATTLAQRLAILQPMRDALRTVAALRSAVFTRLDVLFEILSLRHQLGVLARADRRFRPTDRLLWPRVQRCWRQWREALVLVQPATVARWRRQGFWDCWRTRSRRRPARPHIDADIRALICRVTRENRLWEFPGSTVTCGNWESPSPSVQYRGICQTARGDCRRPGARSWRTTSVTATPSSSLTSSGGRSHRRRRGRRRDHRLAFDSP